MTSILDRLSASPEADLDLNVEPLDDDVEAVSAVRFWAPPVLGLLAGVPLVVYSFYYAATHQTTQVEFDLFWLGIFAFAIPACYRALGRRATSTQRWVLIAMVGAWDFFPKFLRNPTSPLYSDEMAHYHQTVQVAQSGHLYPTNTLIPIISQFPGQQALVAAIHDVTGLSIWAVAEILLAFFHVAAAVGIMALAARLTGSYRAAAIAALTFTVTPNFMFFDSEYSYESFAVPMVIWTLVAVVNASGRGERPRTRWAWTAVGSVTGLACVITHHLSSYVLAVLLVLIAGAHTYAGRKGLGAVTSRAARKAAWTLAAVVVGGAGLWLIPAHDVFGYYSPYITGGVNEVFHILDRTGKSRTLFKASPSPLYEKACAFLSPLIMLALVVVAFRRHRRRLVALGPAYVVLSVVGAVGYFASLPFLLTAFGNEGGRRSWTFSYIGLALLAGAVMDHYLSRPAGDGREAGQDREAGVRDSGRGRGRGRQAIGVLRRRRWPLITAVALVVLLIGNTDSSVDVEYRFPGPYVYGSDTRSITDELMYVTRWFEKTQPPDPTIITDRYTGLPLGGFAGANLAQPSKGFPFWDLYFKAGQPPVGLLTEIGFSGYDYLIIDDRMAKYLPAIGAYFTASEPGAFEHKKPVPLQALTRYHLEPWATEVLNTNHYSVYRLNPALLQGLSGS